MPLDFFQMVYQLRAIGIEWLGRAVAQWIVSEVQRLVANPGPGIGDRLQLPAEPLCAAAAGGQYKSCAHFYTE